MKPIFRSFCILTMAAGTAWAQQDTNAPPPAATATNQIPGITNGFPMDATIEDLQKMVLKPPTGQAPIPIIPSRIETNLPPPLSADALKHQYLGFRLGISTEEASLIAQTAGKKLSPVEEGKRYSMEGCLIDVPERERSRTVLMVKNGKIDLIILYWDDQSRLFMNLEQLLIKKYGRAGKADELFRRFWFLENGDCIRLLYEVAARQTSLVFGEKKSVFKHSDQEKRDIQKDFPDL